MRSHTDGRDAGVRAACERVAALVASQPAYGHTSHLSVQVAGETVYDQHFRGPFVADVFSVTKTVVATVAGIARRDGLLPPLTDPVVDVLPELKGTPAAGHTWRHLLTMTRGAAVDGPWDVDEVTALPGGQVRHLAQAPQLSRPGATFRYDNGAAHLVSAALSAVLGDSVAGYGERELFTPLGITDQRWLADPHGVSFGYGHLSLSATDLLRLGQLWLHQGRWGNRVIADPAFVREMTTRQSAGGGPEGMAYGYLTWVDDGGSTVPRARGFLAGGWAGQHVVVLPAVPAVIVTTGDPQFSFGPPPHDQLRHGWRPALELVRQHIVPAVLSATD